MEFFFDVIEEVEKLGGYCWWFLKKMKEKVVQFCKFRE